MAPSSSTPVPVAKQKKLKDLLNAKGHDKDKVDKLKVSTRKELIEAILSIHGVSLEEYEAAGGKEE